MGIERDFVGGLHGATQRDYVGRVTAHDKADCAAVAKQWGHDYWDGDRRFGYGGYRYDGRWRPVAEAMAEAYGLKPGMRVLDVGCGKAHLIYEMTQAVPGLSVVGLDLSHYGLVNAKPELAGCFVRGSATALPFAPDSFDLVISLAALHNLTISQLSDALREIQRVGTGAGYVMVESYRTEREKMNLLYWQLTCESFHRPEDWRWIFQANGYTGDYGFIYFE